MGQIQQILSPILQRGDASTAFSMTAGYLVVIVYLLKVFEICSPTRLRAPLISELALIPSVV